MKEYNKYLIIGVVIIIIALLFYYFSNLKEESFTHEEEQIITAQLLAANGGFIPKTAIGGSGNPDDIRQYKYMNSSGINVNAMPLNVQQLTNPLCFNDVLHSHPYSSSNNKGGAYSKGNHGANLNHDKFEKEETPALKQLIKANDQLIDANEELLRLNGKGEYKKQREEHEKLHRNGWKHDKDHDKSKDDDKSKEEEEKEKRWKSTPTLIKIDDHEDGKQTITIDKGTDGNSNLSATNRSASAPTYSSAYEKQNISSAYTKCLTSPYGKSNPEYCNNMYGAQYGETTNDTKYNSRRWEGDWKIETPSRYNRHTRHRDRYDNDDSSGNNSMYWPSEVGSKSGRYSRNYDDEGTGLSWFRASKNGSSDTAIIDPNETVAVNNGGQSYNLPSYDNIEKNGIDNLGLSGYGAKQVLHRTNQPNSSSFFSRENGFDPNQYDSKVGTSFTDINTGKSMVICSTDADCDSKTKCVKQSGWGVKTCR